MAASSMIKLVVVVCLVAATHAAERSVPEVRIECESIQCTNGHTGEPVGWKYGRSPRGGNVNVDYLADGSVKVVVKGYDEAGKTVNSNVTFENAGAACVGAVSSDGSEVTFEADVLTQCGFRSELAKNRLHRTNTVHVVHTFSSSGEDAVIVGVQLVTISVTLLLNDPANQIIFPAKPEEDANVAACNQYTHKIEAGETLANCFNATIKADNYDADNLGIGFQVVDCNLHFVIENPDPTAPPVYTTFQSNPRSLKFIDDGRTSGRLDTWIIGQETSPGKSYTLAWRAFFPIGTSAAHAPRFECSVCLCSLEDGGALKRCPQQFLLP